MDVESIEHVREAVPVRKMDSGDKILAYRWKCSCGREGKGWHSNIINALEASKGHLQEK